jgi:hypothetical protein
MIEDKENCFYDLKQEVLNNLIVCCDLAAIMVVVAFIRFIVVACDRSSRTKLKALPKRHFAKNVTRNT